ncbi:MAG: peptidylprolyl isomerase [Proteobacteria bacterium]|jgi:peptidylprolyl isomerase|nr:peptidylprolyl isomerase [Pseudomonadota bacterium]
MPVRYLNVALTVSLILTAAWLSGCNLIKKAAKNGDTVKVHYTGKLEDGTIFDSSKDREPMEFTLGQGQTIPGFEMAITGMKPGETKTVTIPSDQAYGPPRKDLIQTIDRSKLTGSESAQAGQRVRVTQPDGRPISVLVVAVTDKTITLDANHPLAGKNLVFEIKLVEISKKKK